MSGYLHGYSPEEQRRLAEQAAFWRDLAILPGVPYQAGESLLEVGCGVGAVLKVVAQAHPGLKLAGIDREERQIAAARENLKDLGADLRLGDALALPWAGDSFDHALMMWFLEHVSDPQRAVEEALRVLKPGGSLRAIETDYSSLWISPGSADFELFRDGLCAVFQRHGRADAGPRIGAWMDEAGFGFVTNSRVVHSWGEGEGLKGRLEYVLAFSEPLLKDMPGDPRRLRQGVADFRAAQRLSLSVYTGFGRK